MKKIEFIKRYGEEAWKESLKKCKHYKETHKEKAKQKKKEYDDAHRDEILQKQKEYNKTPKRRAANLASSYNQRDKARGFDISNNVDSSYILKRIFTAKCVYCGDSEWRHLGCDRIDNAKPHTPDNVVCACGICNAARRDRMSMEEMLEHRTTNPRMLRNMNAPIEKTPTGAIKKRVFAVIG